METFFALLTATSMFTSWTVPHKLVPLIPTCNNATAFTQSAARNGDTIATAEIAPFGRPETGWQIYAPQVAAEVGTLCAPDTPRFAAAVATWQAHHQLTATGIVGPQTIAAMKQTWQGVRPFIAAFKGGSGCPEPARNENLIDISAREGWSGKHAQLDRDTLAAFRRMVAAARAADPRIAANKQMLTVVSAYRSPEYDAAACADGHCNGIAKAKCSAHRTGTAIDLYVGAAQGHSPVDSKDENRLYQTQTVTYHWLVQNAARFGFVNYVFEPWHWEWTGNDKREAVVATPRTTRASGK